jgi:predicted ATPase
MKSIESIDLDLGGLTVLIGDNGTGKSTILEALELLRVSAQYASVAELIRKYHGGMPALAAPGAGTVTVGASIDAPPDTFDYCVGFDAIRSGIVEEILTRTRGDEREEVFDRTTLAQNIGGSETVLGMRAREGSLLLIQQTLAAIDVHVPFDVSAGWATRRYQRTSTVRGQDVLQPATRLELFGTNLANVYHTLKNEYGADHWRTTMELVQLGLGHDVSDVATSASAGGGYVGLVVHFGSARVPAFSLADGELTYLAFVALVRLDAGRSLLAFDEPETHLHPALLARVVDLLEDAAQRYPVVISTHSDQLLDCLSDPVASVVVCELDRERCTRLRRLDPEQFDKWRENYRGVGSIRAEGQLRSILRQSEEP